ncbi:hypothetical protein QQ008_18240 [Fulvivirgaceae bacterium BMA10]|uniref:SGNH/GDSL hydrolase family protein n=1 Tax=Splendidivirga corallicola TaxID=3051826 RepID=A0ABT8KRE9_9BACT|nr:hypothetical protein [Fulvivirgaceae bacterium BMA10]
MRKGFKVILYNILILLSLMVLINWLSGVYMRKVLKPDKTELPNYKDEIEYAKKIYADYRSTENIYKPFVGWTNKPYRGTTLTINEAGDRVHEPNKASLSGKKGSIRFFGGSTMWGVGTDDQNTIPALFDTVHPGYTIYNHGQIAYTSRQSLARLTNLIYKNEPIDKVVFYDGVNEVLILCRNEMELPSHLKLTDFKQKLEATFQSKVVGALNYAFLKNTVELTGKIRRGLSDKKEINLKSFDTSEYGYDCFSNPEKMEMVAEGLLKCWEMAHSMVTSRGGDFIAILQPVSYVGSPKVDHLEMGKVGSNMRSEAERLTYTVFYEILKAKIKEKDYDWIYDLSDAFDLDKYIYVDACHVSANGNEIIAKRIKTIFEEKFTHSLVEN